MGDAFRGVDGEHALSIAKASAPERMARVAIQSYGDSKCGVGILFRLTRTRSISHMVRGAFVYVQINLDEYPEAGRIAAREAEEAAVNGTETIYKTERTRSPAFGIWRELAYAARETIREARCFVTQGCANRAICIRTILTRKTRR